MVNGLPTLSFNKGGSDRKENEGHKGLLGMETHTSLCPTYSLAAAPRAPWGRVPGGPWPVFEIDMPVLARSEQRNSGGDTVLTWLRVTRVAECPSCLCRAMRGINGLPTGFLRFKPPTHPPTRGPHRPCTLRPAHVRPMTSLGRDTAKRDQCGGPTW